MEALHNQPRLLIIPTVEVKTTQPVEAELENMQPVSTPPYWLH